MRWRTPSDLRFPEKPVYFSVPNLEAEISYGGKCAKLFDKCFRADGNLSAQFAVVVPRGKLDCAGLMPQSAQLGHKRVLESRFIDTNLAGRQPRTFQFFGNPFSVFVRITDQQVETVAKPLDVNDFLIWPGFPGEFICRLPEVRCAKFEPLRAQAGAQLRRRADLMNLALVHERDAMAALGFVQVRCSDKDRQTLRRQVGEHVPKFTAGYRINAGSWLIEQQNSGLRHERGNKGQFLFHSTTQFPSEPVRESVHIKHSKILAAALGDLIPRNASQVATVANVFRNS